MGKTPNYDELRKQVGKIDELIEQAERELESNDPNLGKLDEKIADAGNSLNNAIRKMFGKTTHQ